MTVCSKCDGAGEVTCPRCSGNVVERIGGKQCRLMVGRILFAAAVAATIASFVGSAAAAAQGPPSRYADHWTQSFGQLSLAGDESGSAIVFVGAADEAISGGIETHRLPVYVQFVDASGIGHICAAEQVPGALAQLESQRASAISATVPCYSGDGTLDGTSVTVEIRFLAYGTWINWVDSYHLNGFYNVVTRFHQLRAVASGTLVYGDTTYELVQSASDSYIERGYQSVVEWEQPTG